MGLLDSLSGGEQPTPIDVLLELLNTENIELKTDLNMTQIKVLFQAKWFTDLLKEENKDKDPYEIFQDCLIYFMQLMTSLKRQRAKEIIEGIKDMREKFMDIPLAQGLVR